MDTLPYRATVFLRPDDVGDAGMELIERQFALEPDAVCWCKVMTEADARATGAWMVARSSGGRRLALAREVGLFLGVEAASAATDDLEDLLAGAVATVGMIGRALPAAADHVFVATAV